MENRPIIETIDANAHNTPVEKFQNLVIRPIIKMKSDHIKKFVGDSLSLQKSSFTDLNQDKKIEFLNAQFNNNNSFKQYIIGIVVGNFSLLELEDYLEYKKELNKRIVQIIKERTISQL